MVQNGINILRRAVINMPNNNAELRKKIAILSGKGGTGKTMVAVNLSVLQKNAIYVDCDVEEPNGHLFFDAPIAATTPINVKIPQIDKELCTLCKACVNFCKFNALAMTTEVMVFDNVCHSCGGCSLVCPQKAISEYDKNIGVIEKSHYQSNTVWTGKTNVGVVTGVPIINKLLEKVAKVDEYVFIDCPPGSACSVLESVKQSNYCVLVAEPTLFGMHNLAMVHELVQILDKPYGVVLNKCVDGFNPSKKYCIDNNIPILAEIPFDEHLGKINSDGEIAAEADNRYRTMFDDLLQQIKGAM